MTNNLPKSFIERLQEKKVIPFVGAGVSMNITDKMGKRVFPGWLELLARSEDVLNAEKKTKSAAEVNNLLNLSKPDFYQAAKIAQEAMGQQWYQFLQTQLDYRIEQIDLNSLAIARAIWKIGSPFIITANYDRSLFWSCANQNDFSRWDIENVVKQGQLLSKGLPPEPTVWHLHGHIDNPERIILTLDGYLKLYPGSRRRIEYKAALDTLRSIMKSYSLLFIGFSLNDTFVNDQLVYVNNLYKGSIGPHYVLTCEDELSRIEEKKLPVIPITFSALGQPLIDKIDEIAAIARAVPAAAITSRTDENLPSVQPAKKSLKRPIHQTIFNLIMPIVVGLLALGTVLDSIGNSLQLITPKITYIFTVVGFIALIAAPLASRFGWITWIDEDERKINFKFHLWHYLGIIGMIILLWVPRMVDFYNAKVDAETPTEPQEAQPLTRTENSAAQVNAPTPENKNMSSPEADKSPKPALAKTTKKSSPVPEKSVAPQASGLKTKVQLSTAHAQALYSQGKYDEAIRECNRILSLQPGHKEAKSLQAQIKNTVKILNQ